MYEHAARVALASLLVLTSWGATGCAVQRADEEELSESNGTGDLGVGTVEGELGSYGSALSCKPIPLVEPLKDPVIVVSLDGLTLHLKDQAGTYDRVFPIGPGALENGVSKTPTGTFYTGSNTTEGKDAEFAYYYPCRIWWEDADTHQKSPVFAGLPFIRLAGPPTAGYGIHGPIDNYTAPNGGALRRGYVSHGCVRMAAADIVEVYARIRKHPRTKVVIQKAVEHTTRGTEVDLDPHWIGAECTADAECAYAGGFCKLAAGATQGTCSARCTRTCADRAGEATTFCATDAAGQGYCTVRSDAVYNDSCKRYEGRLVATSATRPDRSATATVCAPK